VPDFTFTVGANGKSSGKMPKGEYESTMSVDPKKDPKTVDNAHESGPHKGKKQFGIYKLDGDKWTVCGRPRHTEKIGPRVSTQRGHNVVFVFERESRTTKIDRRHFRPANWLLIPLHGSPQQL
jgi:uncharacterized protein (TIGR03067 family)